MSEQPPQRPMSPSPEECEDPFAFGAALRRLRLEAKLSLRKLRERIPPELAVSHATLENWGKGVAISRQSEPTFLFVLGVLGVTEQVDLDAWLAAARELRTHHRLSIAEPYRGLKSYDAEYAQVFFGRGALVKKVLRKLEQLRADGGAMVLTGASGAGKSSLLNAGVIPALNTDSLGDSASWPIVSVRFESEEPDPLYELAGSIAELLKVAADEVVADLQDGPETVAALWRRIAVATGSSNDESAQKADIKIVLVLDQLERAIVSAEDGPGSDEKLEAFFAVLRTVVATMGTIVIFSVRLDFLPVATSRRSMQALTQMRSPVLVEQMSDEDLAKVIVNPARAFRVDPEPGFVELVLGDVSARSGRLAHQADILPLLSHALQMTWQLGSGKEMTRANYREVGGVEGALSATAEQIYEKLTERQQKIARQIFLTLVHVQPSGSATRRQVTQEALFNEVDYPADDLDDVLDKFVTKRLITIAEATVEITHEALMVAWEQLYIWINASRGGRLVAQQVIADAEIWETTGRPSTILYDGPRLQAAQTWREEYFPDTNERARAFIDASTKRSRRKTRMLWVTIVVLVALLVGAGTLAGIVTYQANNLQRQRDEAQSRTLASQASILRNKDVNLSRQLALIAFGISPTTEARSALIDATAQRPAIRMLGGDTIGIMYAVGIHPKAAIAAVAAENTVQFWDLADPGHPVLRPALPEATCGKIYALAFSPNGNLLAASCGDGSIHLWDTRDPMNPAALPPLTGLGSKVYSVTFSPDGGMMAAAIADTPAQGAPVSGSVRLWSITGNSPQSMSDTVRVDDDSPAKSVAFRPGNQELAVGTNDGTVQIWDISDPRRPADPIPAAGTSKAIGQLAFSPNGALLAAGGADNLVHLWSTTDPRNPVLSGDPIGGTSTWINAIAFSPEGASLAIASSDGNKGVRLVDVVSRRVTATMPHPSPVTSVRFSPDGTNIISGANDGIARIWPVRAPVLENMDYIVSAAKFSPSGNILALGSADLRLFDVTDPVRPRPLGPPVPNGDKFSGSLAFAPNSSLLVESRGKSGTVQLWNIADPTRMVPVGPPLKAHTQIVETVAISPDSTILATGSRDGTVRLWDIRTPETPVPLSAPGAFGSSVNEVGFSRDGKTLVAASADKTLRLWDITNPKTPAPIGAPFAPANHYVYSAVFSPDDTQLAVSLADGTVRLYDITDKTNLKPIGNPLTGIEGYAASLAFTTDGTAIAATASDGTVWIWNLHGHEAPTHYATLRTGIDATYPVNYQPHSQTLVAGGGEQKAWIWTTDIDAAAALICNTTGDRITSKEWTKYLPADRTYKPPC